MQVEGGGGRWKWWMEVVGALGWWVGRCWPTQGNSNVPGAPVCSDLGHKFASKLILPVGFHCGKGGVLKAESTNARKSLTY